MKRIHFILLGVLFFSAPALSSDQSKVFLKKGHAFLMQKKFEKAMVQMEAAIKADSKDAEAFFFKGVTLNRLSDGKEAAKALDQSQKMGYRHPEWDFERGWSHLLLREWKPTIKRLKKFDKEQPGRGQTSEFIARAYIGLGENKKAFEYLNEAYKRDPKLSAIAKIRRR